MAALLLAIAPADLGGVGVHAGAGPVRDAWLNYFRSLLPDRSPVLRMPAQIAEERLLGGLDLAGTLRQGRPVHQGGLLAEADGGVVVAAMAERLAASTVAHLGTVLDRHEVIIERDGISMRAQSRIGVVALDESSHDDEGLAPALQDRLAFLVDLTEVPLRFAVTDGAERPDLIDLRRRYRQVAVSGNDIAALTGIASALGIPSLRAPLHAVKAARAAAALRGAGEVEEEDLQTAARLVLAPRARQLPQLPDAEEHAPEPPDAGDEGEDGAESDDRDNSRDDPSKGNEQLLEDVILEAVLASLPKDMLAKLAAATAPQRNATSSGTAGSPRRSRSRGRPIGVVRGEIGHGARLSVVDTLRAAAPWQRLRGGGRFAKEGQGGRLAIRPDDFRIRKYAQRSEALTIFIVDASGSTALHRLGEAKGAVELLLADCYVRRDHVALVALRGREAEIILPPTRALARAKRSLSGLPGGGGTPLASGLEQAMMLVWNGRRRDQHPSLVLLTDGAANVARDGSTGRRSGQADALAVARNAAGLGVPVLVIDTGPRPSQFARELSEALRGQYFALPMANAEAVSQIVKTATAQI